MKRGIKRDKQGRFARVLVTVRGTAIAAMCYGAFVGGFVLYKQANTSETFSVGPEQAQAASSEIFPIGETKEYDPCELADVLCEDELPKPENEVERLIFETFPEDPETALAIAKAESRMDSRAMGWNCRYGGVSMACKPEDRGKAWSVDCGLYQLNRLGQSCPPETFDISHNITKAREMYERRGWKPWVAYTSGKYLKYLSQ